MAVSGATAGASTSTPAPPPPSTLARTSPPPSTLDTSRISPARTSPPPSTLDSSRGQVMDAGEPLMRTDGGGAPMIRTDETCVGRVGDQGTSWPELRADGGGGDDPLMRIDAGGGKRPQTSQCKNSELTRSQRKKPNESCLIPTSIVKEKEKNQKVVKATDKIEKEKNQKVVKANDKIEKEKNQNVVKANDKIEKEKNQKMVKANDKIEKKMLPLKPGTASDGGRRPQCENEDVSCRKKLNESCLKPTIIKTQVGEPPANLSEPTKPRSEKIRKIKSASPRVSSPIQVTSSPGVNYLARVAAVKREAARRGSPSTPKPHSQNQVGSPSLQDLSPDTRATMSQASNRKRRKLTSGIWTEAEPIYKEGKVVQGKCLHCHQIFEASRESGTSQMKRHLTVCEAKTSMCEMVSKLGRPVGLDPDWKFNPDLARRKLLKMIVINEMPFTLVEKRPFREFTKALNPWFPEMSRTTIKNDCVDAFKYHGDEMKEKFLHSTSRISLTGDMWTSNQKLGYFCLTAHFIEERLDTWKLHKYIIRFAMMETPHSSINIFNLVLKSLQEWNIEDKLFSFTLDNATVNIAMVNSLRTNLKNKGFLVLEGKLLHFRCATHVFNLIVQDGLKVISNIVSNIRESVRYVRSSQSRIDKFVAIIIQEGLSAKHPCPDVSSRWNSIFLMLQTTLPLRNAFLSLEIQDKDYSFAPLNSEWELAEAVMKLLEVFYIATNTLSGSKYPTSHLYFYQLWSIKKLLNREESILNRKIVKKDATGQDMTVAQMISEMQAKFNQYWKETYMSACIPVIFDPRYKYDLLEYLLGDFGTEKQAETWMDEVKKNMQELFNEYKKEFGEGETHRETDTDEVQDVDDPLADAGWDQYVKSRRRQSNNELEQYLKEQLTPRKEEVDILHWWKTKSETYPVLSAIARDVLAISASTVPSESAFSTGGRVISDYRSSLKPTTVEALMCLHDWFKAADARKNEE